MKCKNCGAELGVNGYCAYCGSYFETNTSENDCMMHKYVLKDMYYYKNDRYDYGYIYIIKCIHCGHEKTIKEFEYIQLVKTGIVIDREKFMR